MKVYLLVSTLKLASVYVRKFSETEAASSDFSAANPSQIGDTMKDIKYRGILLATTFMYTNPLIGREQNVAILLYRA